MIEFRADITTGEGRMPTFIVTPSGIEACPGVVVYMDLFGPREELFDICRRFASCGYATFLPNLFYRLGSPSFPPQNTQQTPIDPRAQDANGATTIEMTA